MALKPKAIVNKTKVTVYSKFVHQVRFRLAKPKIDIPSVFKLKKSINSIWMRSTTIGKWTICLRLSQILTKLWTV